MHQAVVKNPGVRFDASFSFADHVCNICKTCFTQMRDLRRVRQHLTDDAAILAANALMSSRPDYCNSLFRSLSSFNMCKLQCIQNTLAIGLSQMMTNTHRHLLFSNDSKTATLDYNFLSNGPTSYFQLVLFCLLLVEDIVQYTTVRIKGSWRFLNSVHLYINPKHFGHSFAFDAPTVWNDLPDEVCCAPTLACFRKK